MVRALALVVVLGGCNAILGIGDVHPGGANGDAPPGTADAPPGTPDAPLAPAHALITTTDYTNGRVDAIDVSAGSIAKDVLSGEVSTSAFLRRTGANTVLANGNMPTNLDLVTGQPPAVTTTYAIAAGSLETDVAVVGNELYFTTFGSAGVEVLDRTTKQVHTIALPAADADGKPNCDSVFYTGVRVYVACSDLDETNYTPHGPGRLGVIDPFNETVLRTIDLPGQNPFGDLEPTEPGAPTTGVLTIGLAPSFTDITKGCLAQIHLTDPETADCLIQNQALGGFAQHAETDPSSSILWIASSIYDASVQNAYGRLVSYDLVHGMLNAPSSMPGQPVVDLAVCPNGDVVASERGPSETGARIFHAGIESPLLTTSLPPQPGGGIVCY